MGDATRPGYNEVDDAGTSAMIDWAGTGIGTIREDGAGKAGEQ